MHAKVDMRHGNALKGLHDAGWAGLVNRGDIFSFVFPLQNKTKETSPLNEASPLHIKERTTNVSLKTFIKRFLTRWISLLRFSLGKQFLSI